MSRKKQPNANMRLPALRLLGLTTERDQDRDTVGAQGGIPAEQSGSNPDNVPADELYRRNQSTWDEDLECQRRVAEALERPPGIDGRCMTLDECGRYFGTSRERIRQIERRALKKCKVRGGLDLERLAPEHPETFHDLMNEVG